MHCGSDKYVTHLQAVIGSCLGNMCLPPFQKVKYKQFTKGLSVDS